MKELPYMMLIARVAKPLTSSTDKAWWYISHNSIEIVALSSAGDTTQVQLTRKQLERALAVMNGAK